MTLNEFYTTVGGNYEDVIARLHSEAFTEKFLRMIPQDNSLPLLVCTITRSLFAEWILQSCRC